MTSEADTPAGGEMRCLHLASGDLWAGAEVQVCNLLTRLHGMDGVRAFAVLLNEGELAERLRAAGVPVTVLDETRLSTWRILRGVRHILRRERIGLIHTHRRKENFIGGLAARLYGCPSVQTVHGRNEHAPRPGDLRARLLQGVDWISARFLQRRIVAVSEILGSELAARYPPGRVAVIPNGVDLAPLRGIAADTASRPLNGRPMEIAVVGRLVPVKRVDLVIRIAAELERTHPGVFRFHVYGEGPQRNSLEEMAGRMLPAGVLSFEGFRTDVTRRLAEHDALLITSDHEGLPTNLLEALALGRPVVARAVGEIPLVLGSALQGACVQGENPATFAGRLMATREAILSGVLDRAALQARAAAYDADATADQYLTLYAKLY